MIISRLSHAARFAIAFAWLLAGTANAVNIATVPVGDAGNAADTRYATPGYGSVGYTYNVGTYEVTAGQYTEFLNAVAKTDTYSLYSTEMWSSTYGCKIQQSGSSGSYTYSVASDFANRPVNNVSYWNACQFANWLHNGQGSGDTQTGAYTLDGYGGPDGGTIQRNPGARWAVTSEDEWYKAAYYKGGSTNAGYWDYPTRGDTVPGQDMADVSGNNANYYTGTGPYPIDSGKYTTVGGEFQNSASPYGTFDQGGNVWEWNEAIVYQDSTYSARGIRGGSFNYDGSYLLASVRDYGYGFGNPPSSENSFIGFRVSEVPEPVTLGLLSLGGVGLFVRRKRFGK